MNSISIDSLSNPFPYEGELFLPQEQRFKEVIIFTHHYGGHKKQLKRHIDFINQIGFKAFAFNLFPQPFNGSFKLLKQPRFYIFPLQAQWKKQIFDILKIFHNESKIFFSFSFSCNVISQIIHQIPKVQAVIFDGGPFAQLFQNPWKYLSYQEVISSPILRAFAILPWNFFCGFYSLKFKIHRSMKKWPQGFPVLSYQSDQDKLVPPESTNIVLKKHTHLKTHIVTLKRAQHLQGMKLQTEEYQKALKSFLTQNATPI